MVDGSSAVNSPSQQMDIQDVKRTRPVSEQRHPAEQSMSRETVREREREDLTASDVGMEHLAEIKDALNEALRPINVALDFEEHDDLEDMIVKVLNRDTQEVIRQIPPEAMLNMAQRIDEMTGLLVDTWR